MASGLIRIGKDGVVCDCGAAILWQEVQDNRWRDASGELPADSERVNATAFGICDNDHERNLSLVSEGARIVAFG